MKREPVNVLITDEQSFPKEALKTIKALQKENADLKETLEVRKLIERAKGILMKKDNLGEKEAFRKIQKLSMDKNLPMKEVAKSVVITAEL